MKTQINWQILINSAAFLQIAGAIHTPVHAGFTATDCVIGQMALKLA